MPRANRYFATAIDTDEYLARCLVYIPLNMVRAGVVGGTVPSERTQICLQSPF